MHKLRGIAAAAALISIVSLAGTLFFLRSTADEVVPVQVAEASDAAAASGAQGEQSPEPAPTQIEPTAVPTEQPATSESAAVVRLPNPTRVAQPEPTVPPAEVWCVGNRAIDVRLGPQDGAEVIGELLANSCGLEQLGPLQDGWMAVRAGAGLDLIEGWVWSAELLIDEPST